MTKWNVDASHTNVGFSVRHMMVSKVRGHFTGFEGTIEGNPEDLQVLKLNLKSMLLQFIQIAKTVTITYVLEISLIRKHIRISHSYLRIS